MSQLMLDSPFRSRRAAEPYLDRPKTSLCSGCGPFLELIPVRQLRLPKFPNRLPRRWMDTPMRDVG